MNIEKLSLEEKIGQIFLIQLEENEITDKTINMIKKYKIGGIILYKRNYQNYKQMVELINKLKEINRENTIPLFISIDQEGGRVNRMPSEILPIRNASKIAATGDINIVKESASIISKMLKETGISINYAPVLDIKRFEENHPIGDRCYGDNKDDVSKYGIEFMKQTMNEGIIPVVKHFPGHGTTKKDSHFRLPIVKEDKQTIEKEDIVPFKKAIENGAEAIMIGHLEVKDMDSKYPASLSKKIIENYLINTLNYKGLIITDDLKMLAIQLRYTPEEASKLAINSGSNIIMLGLKYKRIQNVINYIIKEVKKGKIDISKIDNSVEKIVKVKEKYNVNDNNITGINIEEINKEIYNLNKKIN